MALNVYRRHRRECKGRHPEDSSSGEFEERKKGWIPVHLVKDGDGSTVVVAVKSVNELGFYNLGLKDLAKKVGLSDTITLAFVWHLKLQEDPNYFRAIPIGKTVYKRYSQNAISPDPAGDEDGRS